MYPKSEPKQINWISVRIALIALLFAAGTLVLIVRAYQLQISDSEGLKKRAEKQRTKVIHLESRRGTILDKSGDQVAVSLEVNSIYAKPKRITDKKEISKVLAEILEIDSQEIFKKLNEDKTFVWIQRRVSPLIAERIKKADLSGILIGTEYQRFYPLKSFAAHVIGFAGLDSSGLEGLELYYDQDLKVDPIPITAQKDALGRPVMFTALGQDPKRRDLQITLDRTIQYTAEKELEEAVQHYKAKSGTIVVLDADSGEVLGLAVRPTYNLNVFAKAGAEVRRNRAVADNFEPGSTFKVFLAATAIELDRIADGEIFDCNNGILKYNGSEIHDVVPHKNLNFEEVIVQSSNIGAVKISEKMRKTEFYRVLNSFGFGSYSGIDLPGERPGVLPLPARWSVLSKANIAFGQGISVNAVQLCTAFAAAINGGNLYKPHLMKRLTNAIGETVREEDSAFVRKVIRDSTSERLVSILRDVVQKGTGKAAAIQGIDVVGKTGTAQKADPNGGYSADRYVSSFIGALLNTKPRLVVFVMLDEPSGKLRQGGKSAAPVFKRVGESILASCGKRPSLPESIVASNCIPSKNSSNSVKSVSLKKGSKDGEWIIPDLKGLNMKQVLEICGKMKCDPSLQGMGFVVNQDPKPGTILKEGAQFVVTFEGQTS